MLSLKASELFTSVLKLLARWLYEQQNWHQNKREAIVKTMIESLCQNPAFSKKNWFWLWIASCTLYFTVTAFLLMKGLLCKQSMHKSEGCYSHMPPINITVEGVQKLLDKLNPYKAPHPDNLQPGILRELSCQIAPVLCNIFKVSVKTGTVPDNWKLANVTPIHKKGLRELPENYWPVSLVHAAN